MKRFLLALNLTPLMPGAKPALWLAVFFFLLNLIAPAAHAMPTAYEAMQSGNPMAQLRYGGSTTSDVIRMFGTPDDVVHSGRMYPVIENYYYYDQGGSGAATLFVFENGFLVGMHLKSPSNELLDLTYFLMNNGDRRLTYPYRGGFAGYYPYMGLFGW